MEPFTYEQGKKVGFNEAVRQFRNSISNMINQAEKSGDDARFKAFNDMGEILNHIEDKQDAKDIA